MQSSTSKKSPSASLLNMQIFQSLDKMGNPPCFEQVNKICLCHSVYKIKGVRQPIINQTLFVNRKYIIKKYFPSQLIQNKAKSQCSSAHSIWFYFWRYSQSSLMLSFKVAAVAPVVLSSFQVVLHHSIHDPGRFTPRKT